MTGFIPGWASNHLNQLLTYCWTNTINTYGALFIRCTVHCHFGSRSAAHHLVGVATPPVTLVSGTTGEIPGRPWETRRALRCWALAGESLAESLAVSAAAGALQILAEEGVADRVVPGVLHHRCESCASNESKLPMHHHARSNLANRSLQGH